MLIQESKSGTIGTRDMILTLALLSLCHSLIEDTILLSLMGADLNSILWVRLAFGLLIVGILARLMPNKPAVSTSVTST